MLNSPLGDHKIENFINVDTLLYSMYIEKRKLGKSIKYYLVHSYREKGKVKKLRRYLGVNLKEKELKKAKQQAEQEIRSELQKLSTEIFHFSLTKNQIDKLNKSDINIHHLQGWSWELFTEQFTYNTNAIEGSTVQLEKVHEILNKKKLKDDEEIETKGVANAVEYIRKTKEGISLKLLQKIHKICFKGSKHFAGQFRNVEVVIRNREGKIIHAGVPVKDLPNALDDMIKWYKKNKAKFKPLVLAAIIHNQFEHIHPFQDGNGRVGRLLLNLILIKSKYPPINISFKDRAEYYSTLQGYHKSQNLRATLKFLIKQYKKTLKQVTTKIKK